MFLLRTCFAFSSMGHFVYWRRYFPNGFQLLGDDITRSTWTANLARSFRTISYVVSSTSYSWWHQAGPQVEIWRNVKKIAMGLASRYGHWVHIDTVFFQTAGFFVDINHTVWPYRCTYTNIQHGQISDIHLQYSSSCGWRYDLVHLLHLIRPRKPEYTDAYTAYAI